MVTIDKDNPNFKALSLADLVAARRCYQADIDEAERIVNDPHQCDERRKAYERERDIMKHIADELDQAISERLYAAGMGVYQHGREPL